MKFSSKVAQLCPTLKSPMVCSTPGFPVPPPSSRVCRSSCFTDNKPEADVKILAQEHTVSIGWKCQTMREYSNAAENWCLLSTYVRACVRALHASPDSHMLTGSQWAGDVFSSQDVTLWLDWSLAEVTNEVTIT